MSYILEALKKLEQKRRREEGTLSLSDNQGATVPRRQPLWIYLLVLALVLNAGLFLWWLHPWRAAHPQKDMLQAASEMSDEPEGRRLSGARGKMREEAIPRPPVEIPRETATAGLPPQAAAAPEESRHEERIPSPKPAPPRPAAASRPERPIDVSQLPPGLKEGLPDLSISGHFFDTAPARRIVIIGGHTLHEGEALTPGLTLEQITRDGVVLNYRGTRFRKGVF